MAADDPFDLQRFVTAQAPAYEAALGELKAGRKRTHWMWFVFPQLKALGRSPTAQFYGIGSLDEAKAYLAHPVLGSRLAACARAVLDAEAPSLHAIFGSPDDLKFVSSMTLFALAEGGVGGLWRRALDRWCGGRMDARTIELVEGGAVQ
jgi:uncharacterized protein (DUF1810 family)